MIFSDLDIRGYYPDVMLLQTPSSNLSIFLEDKMKLKYHTNSESIITVETKSDYKKIKDVTGITPQFAQKWFIKLDVNKFHDKDIIKIMQESPTCFFFCLCSRYATFKELKEKLKGVVLADFYVNYLKRPDIIYLYDALTLESNKLDNVLLNYVIQSYSGDVDAVLELFKKLNQGEKFNSRQDIAKVCGIGGNSIESFIFLLTKPVSGSDKGLKTVIKNRLAAGIDLGETLGWTKFYNFMSSSIERLCEIKMLSISGIIYKRIQNLPEGFDEQKLSRYQNYMWKINEIPLSTFLQIKQCMGSVWRKDIDFINFVYQYYSVLAMNKVKEMAL